MTSNKTFTGAATAPAMTVTQGFTEALLLCQRNVIQSVFYILCIVFIIIIIIIIIIVIVIVIVIIIIKDKTCIFEKKETISEIYYQIKTEEKIVYNKDYK